MWRYHCLELYFLVPFIVVYRHFLHLFYHHHHHHHHHLHHLHHYYYFLKIFQPKSCKELLDLIEELQPLVIEDGVALVGSRTSFIISAAISYSLSLCLSVSFVCVCFYVCVCVCSWTGDSMKKVYSLDTCNYTSTLLRASFWVVIWFLLQFR